MKSSFPMSYTSLHVRRKKLVWIKKWFFKWDLLQKKKGTMLAISIGSSGINKSNVKHGSLPTQRVEKRVKVLTVKEICWEGTLRRIHHFSLLLYNNPRVMPSLCSQHMTLTHAANSTRKRRAINVELWSIISSIWFDFMLFFSFSL